MNFISRSNNSFLILAVILLGIFLLFQFLPFILLAVAVGAAVRYAYKYIKTWNLKRSGNAKFKANGSQAEEKEDEFIFNNSNVIDVEYTDVK